MPLHEITAEDDRSLQDVADLIARSHRIIVVTGAGISTSCGIPDFRSKDGLYNLIPEQTFLPTPPSSAPSTPSRKRKAYTTDDEASPPSSQSSTTSTSSRRSSGATTKLRGQDLFDSSVWKNPAATATFYQFIASLREKIHSADTLPSLTHKFIRTLRDGGRLMRCYTQNIDGLEARDSVGLCLDLTRGRGNKRRFMKKNLEVPVPVETVNTDFDRGCEVVSLHGDLERLRCTLCQHLCEWTYDATEDFLEGKAPECEECSSKSDKRQASGKRGLAVGSLRPNIVLYGEEHPSNTLLTPLVPFDVASEPEILIIMGTSLKVFGLQKIVRDFARAVHAHKNGKGKVIFVNRTRPAESVWEGIIDTYVAMDCDEWVRDLKTRREDIWLRQGELDLKVTKPVAKRKRKSTEDGQENKAVKKSKTVIEISKLAQPGPIKSTSKSSLASKSGGPAQSPVLATPRVLSRSWKLSMANHPHHDVLSPLVRSRRPHPSPLPNSFKPFVFADMHAASQSPQRPPFSPLTPTATPQGIRRRGVNTPCRRMEKIWTDVVAGKENSSDCPKIAEGDDQQKEPDDGMIDHMDVLDGIDTTSSIETEVLAADTPSKVRKAFVSILKAKSQMENIQKCQVALPKQSKMALALTEHVDETTTVSDTETDVAQSPLDTSDTSLVTYERRRLPSLFASAASNYLNWALPRKA